MMFQWKEDMVRFMRDASEYGSFNETLASLIAPHISKESHICDAGCGLGYLSLALSPFAGRVTSVDINENALQVLKDNCSKRNVKNISIHCGNISSMSLHKPFDHMVFCFFGGIEEVLSISSKSCSGKVFIVTRKSTLHRFSVQSIRTNRQSLEGTCSYLDNQGIPYEKQELALEMGQPFRDFKAARCFFETYSQDEDKSLITDEFVGSRLISTGREDFPLYMPHKRQLGLLMLEAENIPKNYKAGNINQSLDGLK